jgi:RNA polymerase sigma-70 factor (ECF subfamily)
VGVRRTTGFADRDDLSRVGDLQDRRDRDLLARTARGEEEAFAELFRRYGSAGLGLAVRVARDRAVAEDVVQEVFVSVWRRASAYDPARGSVRSWLLAQIHHRAVDAIRREEAQRRRAMGPAPVLTLDAEDVIEEDWLRSRRLRVRDAMRTLSDEQRSILELAYFDGLTQAQIATKAAIPLGTVKSRTVAAMRKLRDAMAGGES